MSATKVYAVTEGSYSDYRVKCLFTTEALAEAHVARLRGDREWSDDPSVEVFLLFDVNPSQATVYSRNARVRPDGTVTSFNRGVDIEQERVEWEYGGWNGIAAPIMEARTYCPPVDNGEGFRVQVSGTDKAKVDKAFQDRIAEAKARVLGVG